MQMETVGKGAFGEVYTALDLQTSETVAIKVETPACKKPVLKLEISVLRKLQDSPYVCRHIAAGRFTWPQNIPHADGMISPSGSPTTTSSDPPVYSYMVMELLGSNLSELRRKAPQGRFSLATTSILAKQMLRSIEALHRIGILHRDVKPGNFCMELTDPSRRLQSGRTKCYLIDFGLSRRYLTASGNVREPRSKVGFRGTARYASVNAHLGMELGRVDDLWSLFYLVVEFLNGQLPWKGKEKDRIGELKQKYTAEDLCLGFPQMLCFHEHLRTLNYLDKPNYDYLETLIHSLFVQSGKPENVPYDWEVQSDPDTLGDTTVTDSIDMAVHVAAGGKADVFEGYPDEDAHFRDREESRHFAAVGSSQSVRPSESGITIEDGAGKRWDRRTSLSSATVTVAHAIGSAFSPASPPSSSAFRIPLSPNGPEPTRRFFADEALGRGRGVGYGQFDVGGRGAYHGEEDEGLEDVEDGIVPNLKSPPPLPRRSSGQESQPRESMDASPHPSLIPTPPADPPKLKTAFRARRYMKFNSSN
ncbi:Tau-tubulin kinase 2 [Dinochytrium kinnereticum]|nr:Tau-tubulin kinase 2 [Dinochytrium kinnereticum]